VLPVSLVSCRLVYHIASVMFICIFTPQIKWMDGWMKRVGTSTNNLYCQKLESLTNIFVSHGMNLSSFSILWWATPLFCSRVLIGCSRSSKVDDFGNESTHSNSHS